MDSEHRAERQAAAAAAQEYSSQVDFWVSGGYSPAMYIRNSTNAPMYEAAIILDPGSASSIPVPIGTIPSCSSITDNLVQNADKTVPTNFDPRKATEDYEGAIDSHDLADAETYLRLTAAWNIVVFLGGYTEDYPPASVFALEFTDPNGLTWMRNAEGSLFQVTSAWSYDTSGPVNYSMFPMQIRTSPDCP